MESRLMAYYDKYRKMDMPILVSIENGQYYIRDNLLQYYVSQRLKKPGSKRRCRKRRSGERSDSIFSTMFACASCGDDIGNKLVYMWIHRMKLVRQCLTNFYFRWFSTDNYVIKFA